MSDLEHVSGSEHVSGFELVLECFFPGDGGHYCAVFLATEAVIAVCLATEAVIAVCLATEAIIVLFSYPEGFSFHHESLG